MINVHERIEIDDCARAIATTHDLIDILLNGGDINQVLAKSSPELDIYNSTCAKFDKNEYAIKPAVDDCDPILFHSDRCREWLTPADDTGLWEGLYTKSKTDTERVRFGLELEAFAERNMLPVLTQLNQLIKTMDDKGIIRGVGRGSSVASFILYLMEVHYIDPIAHDLDFSEFLR